MRVMAESPSWYEVPEAISKQMHDSSQKTA